MPGRLLFYDCAQSAFMRALIAPCAIFRKILCRYSELVALWLMQKPNRWRPVLQTYNVEILNFASI
jgi:hypothetical protein